MKIKKLVVFILLIIILLFVTTISCSLYDVSGPVTPPNEDDWNQPKEKNIPDEFASLYELTEVTRLEKLFVNSTFIKHVTVNKTPYLHGFSSDGRYVAFISYTTKNGDAYLIQIFDTLSGETAYSTVLLGTDNMLESKELSMAQQALDEGYGIDTTPLKMDYANGMEYTSDNDIWIFENEESNGYSYLKVSKQDYKESWLIYSKNNLDFKDNYVQMFTFPGNSNLVVFLFQQIELNESFTPIFLKLEGFTEKNSEKAIYIEADKWLYGNFEFAYNQWDSNNNKGFFAISSDNNINNESYDDFVEQWAYLDSTGKMKWYGNIEGMFNFEAKSTHSLNSVFYYRVRLLEDASRKSISHKNTNKLVRIIEFKWDEATQEMVPIQPVQIKN